MAQPLSKVPVLQSAVPNCGKVTLATSLRLNEEEDEARGLKLGALDFISKPFKTEEILKKVKSQLKLPESKQEAPAKNAEAPVEPENSEVVQREFKDIVDQLEGTASDSAHDFFDDDGDSQPSINEIDLESDTPTKQKKVEVSQKENPQGNPQTHVGSPENGNALGGCSQEVMVLRGQSRGA